MFGKEHDSQLKAAMRSGKKDPLEILELPSIADVVAEIDAELDKLNPQPAVAVDDVTAED